MIAYCLECDWSDEYTGQDLCPDCGARLRVPDVDELVPEETEDKPC